MSMLSAALSYAELGLCVFALRPREKAPATAHGLKDATTEPGAVRAMWGDPSRNVGIAMGVDSGVFAIDIDGEPGELTLRSWQALHGALPVTPTAVTARGMHVYFRHPGEQVAIRNSAKRVGDGVDVRTDGGYLVAPPSIHPSGDVYRWAEGKSPREVPFADAPEWLIRLLVDKPKPQRVEYEPTHNHFGHTPFGERALEQECDDLARAPEGERNDRLNAVAFRVGQLVAARHLSHGAAVAEVRRAAEACGLDKREIEKTLASGVNAGLAKPNTNDPRPEELRRRRAHRDEPEETPPPGPEEWAAAPPEAPPEPTYHPTLTAEETVKCAVEFIADPTRGKLPRAGFPRLDDAIGGFAPGTMFTVGGRTGSGKSSLLLAMGVNQCRTGLRVGIVSCEDAEWIWGVRIIAALRDVNPKSMLKTPADEYMVGQALRGMQDARDMGMHFAFTIGKPIKNILDAIHALVRKQGCNVIMVDYLQAIAAKGQDRYVARTDAAQAIKGMCHDAGVPLVMASQLKRPESGNPYREPNHNDLKDSGDIENMSEAIVLLWPTSDEEKAPVIGKVTKVKLSDGRPRFMVQRSPESGAIVSLLEPPADTGNKPRRGGFMDDRYGD